MILTTETGASIELNDLCNLDHVLSRYFNNRYFSAQNQKIWKSKVTHFDKINGYFRERIKAPRSGFCYKIAQIKPDGSITQIHNQLTAAESLKTYREILRYAAHPNQ
jgi:hypothetical protein